MGGIIVLERDVADLVALPSRWRNAQALVASEVLDAPCDVLGGPSPTAIAVLYRSSGTCVSNIEQLRGKWPQAALWMVGDRDTSPARVPLAALARAGLDDWYPLMLIGEEERLLEDAARRACIAVEMLATHQLPNSDSRRSSLTHAIVHFCLRNADRRLSVEDVAGWFGEHRRSIDRWLVRETGVATAAWLRTGRLHVGRALREDGVRFEKIARVLGYASTSGAQLLVERARSQAQPEIVRPLSHSVVARSAPTQNPSPTRDDIE